MKSISMTSIEKALAIVSDVIDVSDLNLKNSITLVELIARELDSAKRQQKLECLAEEKETLTQINQAFQRGATP